MKYIKKFEDLNYDLAREKALKRLSKDEPSKDDLKWFKGKVKQHEEEEKEIIVHGVDDDETDLYDDEDFEKIEPSDPKSRERKRKREEIKNKALELTKKRYLYGDMNKKNKKWVEDNIKYQ